MIGRVLEGKYELIALVGEGGMGSVYRARRIHIGDEVAVKVLHKQYVKDVSALERFRREARAAAVLHHPNVVAIYDYGEARADDAPAFIVMELVAGRSLRQIIERAGQLPADRAVSLMRSICAGVGAAHRNNIIHRDLKPDNIIVLPPDSDDESEKAKVVDFGIAKLRDMAASHALTQTGAVIGTPYYMSPEQCRAEQLDARSDVYSLGAMLYEMLAGAPPFTAATITGVVAKHLTEPPPPLPAHVNVSPSLEAVILRTLAKDPAARQPDALAFARDLQSTMTSAATRPVAPTVTAPSSYPPATRQGNPSDFGAPLYAPVTSPQAAFTTVQKKSSRSTIILGSIIAVLALTIAAWLGFQFMNKDKAADANRNTAAQASSNAATAGGRDPRTTLPGNQNSATSLPIPDLSAGANNANQAAGAASGNRGAAEAIIVKGAPLGEADILGLSDSDLRLLRNTIFARHGRIFDSPELQRYFNSRPWYTPRDNYSDGDLTPTDRANLSLIRAVDGRSGAGGNTSSAVEEVRAALNGWVTATRAHDLEAHVGYYAETVDPYYGRSAVSKDFVRSDRARAFNRFSSLDVQLSNVSIKPDPSGTRATATFDKTYTFQGQSTLSGSVQQFLWLAKMDGGWRITGEKDLQVYYSR